MVTTEHPNANDDMAISLLREALQALPMVIDPSEHPPATVIDGATWVHDWLNMEAELAELTFDSTADLGLAGVRSDGTLRELTFVSGQHTVEIEIESAGRTVIISGAVEPPTPGAMQLVVGGQVYADNLDSAGSFEVNGVARGTVLAFIETPSSKIRLGSFEV
ncbi:MAG: hypothetical protein GY724_03805 [Actinomycetia bacterium]|nr:hypothetical protein [Actinomycetes bacterium]MCP4227557.1 hypothetical protein [Actinomycetes bacterium]MCP5034420.1 hypothetical protein [Actinomycetes bacterium]